MKKIKHEETVYINPLIDFGFKRIFGNERVMMGFLNALIQVDDPDTEIVDLVFLPTDTKGEADEERGVIYDLRCKTNDGSEFIVEMQKKGQSFFNKRILFYLSRAIASQDDSLKDEKWRFQTHNVYGVFLMNFYDDTMTEPVRHCVIKDYKSNVIDNYGMQYWKIELPFYRKIKESDCKTHLDKWLYIIANMKTMKAKLPFTDEIPILRDVEFLAKYSKMNTDDRNRYWKSYDQYVTTLGAIDYAREEGAQKERSSIVLKMSAKGYSAQDISEIAEIPVDEVEMIIKNKVE